MNLSLNNIDNPALIIIDMQEIFKNQDSQWYCPEYNQAEDNVQKLIKRYPKQVVWTRFVRDPKEVGSWQDYYRYWDECRLSETDQFWDITLSTQDHDQILTLPTFSKWGDELKGMTEDNSVLIICGVATDCCVISTALGAVDAGKSVIVPRDACAGATLEIHTKALDVMSMLSPMLEVVTTEDLLSR